MKERLKNKPVLIPFVEFQKRIVRRIVWPYSYRDDDLIRWRAFILSSIILTGLLLGSVALLSSLVLIIREGAWVSAGVDLLGILLCLIFLFVEKIRFEVRASLSLLMFFVIGLTVILSFGPLSGGPAWLFTFAVLAGALIGRRAAFCAIILNALSLTIISVLIYSGQSVEDFPFFKTPQNMIAAGVNFIILNLIATVSVSALLKGLVHLFEKKETLTKKIEFERTELLGTKKQLESEIKKRESAAQNLIETKDKYKKFVDDAPMAMYTLNSKGEFTYANKKLLAMTGYRKEDWLGRPFLPILHPDDQNIAIEKFQKRISGKSDPDPYEIRILHSSGETMWVEIFSETLMETDGAGTEIISGSQSFITDITDRKNAEYALQESEQKYRNLFELESDTILLIDNKSGAILESNSSAIEMYGYTKKEFLGLNIKAIETEGSKQNINRQETPGHQNVAHHQKKDGTVFPVEIASRQFDWNGCRATLLAIRDITWRIESDAERGRLEEELYYARKMESIGTLAGGIAHDFNNILHIMIGNCELAMEEGLNKTVVENLNNIKEAGLRAADIVKQLLSFNSRNEHDLKPIEAVSLVRETLRFFRSTIPKTIAIKSNLSAREIIILANDVQVNQVLMNLFINASQAMEDTGGFIEIKVAEIIIQADQIELASKLQPGAYIEIQVNDNGPGIDSSIIDKIFDPYFTTKGFGKGSGMGLAVVHGIVKKHKGLITAKSTLGIGTKFKIILPQTKQKPELIFEDRVDKNIKGSGHLLFVDDEELLTEMIRESLEGFGYQVTSTLSPVEALKLFKLSPDTYDLLITDMTMPEMRGDELAKKILEIRYDIPIIICSGFSSSMDEQKAKSIGVTKYLMKPVLASDLSIEINRILNKKST